MNLVYSFCKIYVLFDDIFSNFYLMRFFDLIFQNKKISIEMNRNETIILILFILLIVWFIFMLRKKKIGILNFNKAFGDLQSININLVPLVNAGEYQIIILGMGAMITGDASDDGEYTTLWTQENGPGITTFSDPTSLSTTVTFDTPGEYTLKLTIDDGSFISDSFVDIYANEYPFVNAGINQTIGFGTSINLSGTAIDDEPITTLWTQTSGPGIATFGDDTLLNSSISFDTVGTYVLTLTADDGTLTSSDDVAITVDPFPIVNAGSDQIIVMGSGGNLAGIVTDNGPFTTLWTQTSGPGITTFGDDTSVNSSISFDTIGTYILTLTADDGITMVSDTVTITVNAPVVIPSTSMYFPGGANDNLSIAIDASLTALRTNDWTIEWFQKIENKGGNGSGDPYIWCFNQYIFPTFLKYQTNNSGLMSYWYQNVGLGYVFSGGPSGAAGFGGSLNTVDTWIHCAVCHNGSNQVFFQNGNQINSVAVGGNSFFSFNRFKIGTHSRDGYNTVDRAYKGFLSNFRIVVGSALYSGSYSVPTSPLTAIPGTVLLLNHETAGTVFDDSSASNRVVTNNGAVVWSSDGPF